MILFLPPVIFLPPCPLPPPVLFLPPSSSSPPPSSSSPRLLLLLFCLLSHLLLIPPPPLLSFFLLLLLLLLHSHFICFPFLISCGRRTWIGQGGDRHGKPRPQETRTNPFPGTSRLPPSLPYLPSLPSPFLPPSLSPCFSLFIFKSLMVFISSSLSSQTARPMSKC